MNLHTPKIHLKIEIYYLNLTMKQTKHPMEQEELHAFNILLE